MVDQAPASVRRLRIAGLLAHIATVVRGPQVVPAPRRLPLAQTRRPLPNEVHEPDWRLEVKATLDARDEAALESWIRSHRLGFTCAFPDRWVNNLYFDSPGLGAYAQNLAGLSRRCKVRLRWYGPPHLPNEAMLELKFRRNSWGAKQRIPVSFGSPADITWRALHELLREQLPDGAGQIYESMSMPVLLNRYHRTYWLSQDGLIRFTVDRRIQVSDQRTSTSPVYGVTHELENLVVFEAKFDVRFDPGRVLSNLPARLSRNSKYALGVRTILEGA